MKKILITTVIFISMLLTTSIRSQTPISSSEDKKIETRSSNSDLSSLSEINLQDKYKELEINFINLQVEYRELETKNKELEDRCRELERTIVIIRNTSQKLRIENELLKRRIGEGLRPWEGTKKQPHPVQIKGTAEFINQTEKALDLLKDKAPDAYNLIIENIDIIQQYNHSGVTSKTKPVICYISDRIASEIVSYAGGLAHESYHVELHKGANRKRIQFQYKHVEREVVKGQNEELQCIGYQISVLEKIGASQRLIDIYKRMDGAHVDIDGDGKRTMKDWRQQKW